MFNNNYMRTLLAVLLSFWGLHASAVPLIYDEAVDGDLSYRSDVYISQPLGFGANMISGTVSSTFVSDNDGYDSDFDLFNVLMPANAILQSVSLDYASGDGGNGEFASWFAVYFSGPVVAASGLTGGSYFWEVNRELPELRSVGLNVLPDGIVNDYTITFNVIEKVSAVPEPGSLGLLSVALLGLGIMRRRNA